MEMRPIRLSLPVSILISALIIAGAVIAKEKNPQPVVASAPEIAAPTVNVIAPLSIPWGDLGGKLVSVGALDKERFLALYSGPQLEEARRLLETDGAVAVTEQNAGIMLNLLWGLGLAQKSAVLEKGMMMDKRFGGPAGFASTGGWTIAVGDPMQHYSHHRFMELTPDEEKLVERVAKGIFRPCCDNATHFPDCNHGMAMLGLLELLVSNGASEQELWRAALTMNTYWFPDTYDTIAAYMQYNGRRYEDADPQEILGATYSSGSGYARIAAQISSGGSQGGGGCGVGAGASAAPAPVRQQGGCGI